MRNRETIRLLRRTPKPSLFRLDAEGSLTVRTDHLGRLELPVGIATPDLVALRLQLCTLITPSILLRCGNRLLRCILLTLSNADLLIPRQVTGNRYDSINQSFVRIAMCAGPKRSTRIRLTVIDGVSQACQRYQQRAKNDGLHAGSIAALAASLLVCDKTWCGR
jgi:hypothetical protein